MMTTTTINPNSFRYKTLKEQVGLSGRERLLLERFAKLAFPGASGQAGAACPRDLWHAILLYVSIKIGIECSAKLGRCSAPSSKSHNNGSRYGQAAPCAMHPSEVDLLNPEPPGQTLQTLTWDHYIPEATPPPGSEIIRYPEPTP